MKRLGAILMLDYHQDFKTVRSLTLSRLMTLVTMFGELHDHRKKLQGGR